MRPTTKFTFWGAVAGLAIWNGSITVPVAIEHLRDKGRPTLAVAYRSWLVSPDTITINLLHVGDEAAPIDVYATLGAASDGLSGRSFETIRLNRWFSPRLLLDGQTFSHIGRQYGTPADYIAFGRTVRSASGRQIVSASYSGGFMASLQNMTDGLEAANKACGIWALGE